MIKQFNLTHKWNLTGLILRVKVSLEVMAMKGYSTLPKAFGLAPHHLMIYVIFRTLVAGGWSYPSDWSQSAISIALNDLAKYKNYR